MWIGVFGSLALTACFNEPPKLTKDEAQLLDAMMFVLEGKEDNTKDDYGLTPWRREVIGTVVELSKLGKNGIGTSDAAEQAKIKDSAYIRYVETISSPEQCVFRRESSIEFSKGKSETDFSAHTMQHETQVFSLANAHTFELLFDHGISNIHLEGPAVMCSGWGYCSNSFDKQFITAMDWDRDDRKSQEVLRRERAIELIKKSCPGKPY